MKNFESGLNRLEEINTKINSNEIDIQEAMKIFEEGIKIAASLQKELDKMERKVEILVNQSEGNSSDEMEGFERGAKEPKKPNLQLFPELDG
jgi:exodeoxyribonuclease VII small subunit